MVRANNNAAAAADAARRFVVGGAVVGRLLEQSADALGRHPEVFSVSDESVTLRAEAGASVRERTVAVARVLDALRAEGSGPMLEGWQGAVHDTPPVLRAGGADGRAGRGGPLRLSGVWCLRGRVHCRRVVGRAVARVGGQALPLQADVAGVARLPGRGRHSRGQDAARGGEKGGGRGGRDLRRAQRGHPPVRRRLLHRRRAGR